MLVNRLNGYSICCRSAHATDATNRERIAADLVGHSVDGGGTRARTWRTTGTITAPSVEFVRFACELTATSVVCLSVCLSLSSVVYSSTLRLVLFSKRLKDEKNGFGFRDDDDSTK